MYAVIFRAKIKQLDDEYSQTAQRMRELAISEYNCIEFTSVCEGDEEIAISYWHSEGDIKNWKNNPEHLIAQDKGRKQWYQSYQVQIVEIKREYNNEQ